MKLTAKMIPIDQRRRRALKRAHAQVVLAARAALDRQAQQPNEWQWTDSHLRAAVLELQAGDLKGEIYEQSDTDD